MADRFTMYYCVTIKCRVNTFERGAGGWCPGCDCRGEPLPNRGHER